MIFIFYPTQHQVTKSSQNHQTWLCTNPSKINSFSSHTLEAFERIESTQFSKIMIFIFHPTHHQVTKSSQNTKITKLGLAPTMTRSIPLATKLFPHHFGSI